VKEAPDTSVVVNCRRAPPVKLVEPPVFVTVIV
jgi:hypothetical protein